MRSKKKMNVYFHSYCCFYSVRLTLLLFRNASRIIHALQTCNAPRSSSEKMSKKWATVQASLFEMLIIEAANGIDWENTVRRPETLYVYVCLFFSCIGQRIDTADIKTLALLLVTVKSVFLFIFLLVLLSYQFKKKKNLSIEGKIGFWFYEKRYWFDAQFFTSQLFNLNGISFGKSTNGHFTVRSKFTCFFGSQAIIYRLLTAVKWLNSACSWRVISFRIQWS